MTEAILDPNDVLAAMQLELQAKAQEDAAFRADLLANPKAAVEKTFGTELPAHIKLHAVEQPADTYVIVVPTAPAVGQDGELSDSDLEAVAGGSKSGARNFFNSIGNTFERTGRIVGSAMGRNGVRIVEGRPDNMAELRERQQLCR